MTKQTKKRPKAKPCVVWCPVDARGNVWAAWAERSERKCRKSHREGYHTFWDEGITHRKFKLVEVRP